MTRRTAILCFLTACVLGTGGTRLYLDHLQIQTATEFPNYSLLEPGLYMGGRSDLPPPETSAVLCLSVDKDVYSTPVYQWQPIADATPAPSMEWLREQVMFVDAQRKAGRTVYVHCDAGISRSGMVIVAYYMWREHWTMDQSLDFVRTKRKLVRPNGAFMELLREWEKSSTRTGTSREHGHLGTLRSSSTFASVGMRVASSRA